MGTYKTYKQAVLANGSTNGISTDCNQFFTDSNLSTFKPCNPVDYLETLESFLVSGKRLCKKDTVINDDGSIYILNDAEDIDDWSLYDVNDDNRFILQAAADQTETPEEKEAFEAMTGAKPQQVESLVKSDWDGEGLPPVGVECVFTPDNTKWGFNYVEPFNGAVLHYEGEQFVFMLNHEKYNLDDSMIIVSRIDKGEFSNPETLAEREERERLEAAYYLYCKCGIQHETVSFKKFKNGDDCYPEVWVDIVNETGYRKETSK